MDEAHYEQQHDFAHFDPRTEAISGHAADTLAQPQSPAGDHCGGNQQAGCDQGTGGQQRYPPG